MDASVEKLGGHWYKLKKSNEDKIEPWGNPILQTSSLEVEEFWKPC